MSVLADIVAITRRKVGQGRANADFRGWERKAAAHIPRGFRQALKQVSESGPAIIAELKKASPSRGLIRAEFDAAKLASQLERASAAALSVLTEEEHFQGSLENLRIASEVTRLPCLRKDFIVDEFQIVEARAYGADAILLIVAALQQKELTFLKRRADELKLDTLCEVHDQEELQRALDAGCNLIGVNNRDLLTFRVDLDTALRLKEKIPQTAVAVAESGIDHGSDIAKLRAAGYKAFLIGETLMRAANPGEALSTLIEQAAVPAPVEN